MMMEVLMKRLFLILTILAIFMFGCSREEPSDAVGAYMAVLDKLYSEDSGLNAEIKYLAIDTSKMVNLTDEAKSKLMKELDKYGLTVLDMTFEELQKEGYIEDLAFRNGILFRIEDEPMSGNKIVMDASKWRSGTGAIGYEDIVVKYSAVGWKITGMKSAWIS
jgi:Ca-activated chloride channel family protein